MGDEKPVLECRDQQDKVAGNGDARIILSDALRGNLTNDSSEPIAVCGIRSMRFGSASCGTWPGRNRNSGMEGQKASFRGTHGIRLRTGPAVRLSIRRSHYLC